MNSVISQFLFTNQSYFVLLMEKRNYQNPLVLGGSGLTINVSEIGFNLKAYGNTIAAKKECRTEDCEHCEIRSECYAKKSGILGIRFTISSNNAPLKSIKNTQERKNTQSYIKQLNDLVQLESNRDLLKQIHNGLHPVMNIVDRWADEVKL